MHTRVTIHDERPDGLLVGVAPDGSRTYIERRNADSKWRLLELMAEAHRGAASAPWPQIVLVGEVFSGDTLAAARALPGFYEVRIGFAESVRFPGPGTVELIAPTAQSNADGADGAAAMNAFFAASGNGVRRTFGTPDATRWSVRRRRAFAYVHQFGRFEGHTEFWQGLLSDPGSVALSSGEHRLRFRLRTAEDFARFEETVENVAAQIAWIGNAQSGPEAEADEDNDRSKSSAEDLTDRKEV